MIETIFWCIGSALSACLCPEEKLQINITVKIQDNTLELLNEIDPALTENVAVIYTLEILLATHPKMKQENLRTAALTLCNAARRCNLATAWYAKSETGPLDTALNLVDETTCKEINFRTPSKNSHDRYQEEYWTALLEKSKKQHRVRHRAHTAPPSRGSSDFLALESDFDSKRA